MHGIRDELIATRRGRGRIEGQAASRLEIQMLVGDAAWWPMVERAPFVSAGIEDCGFGELPVPFSLQPVRKPARLQRPVVVAGGPTEARVAERDPGVPEPLTVVPRSHDEVVEAPAVGL